MPAKVLIVDNHPTLIEQTLQVLHDQGVELRTAADGTDALKLIDDEWLSLVFLGVQMPKMNGLDVCKAIKKERGLKDVYVVMLTAKGQEFDKKRRAEVGADVYMTKPFDPNKLLDKARDVLGL